MEKKLKVADFAALLGIVPKTVYKMIEREEVVTVTERVNNRNTTLIITNDEEIQEFKKTYGKDMVNTGNYYENVTDNNQSDTNTIVYEPVKNNQANVFTNEVIDRILALNDGYNEQLNLYNDRLQKVNEELSNAKAQQLLLEDKAGREGLYITEIKELKTDNNRLRTLIYWLVGVIVILLLCLTGYFTYNLAVNSSKKPEIEQNQPPAQEQIINQSPNVTPAKAKP